VALRKCPQLPPTIAERITDYYAQNNADWVMYRLAFDFLDVIQNEAAPSSAVSESGNRCGPQRAGFLPLCVTLDRAKDRVKRLKHRFPPSEIPQRVGQPELI